MEVVLFLDSFPQFFNSGQYLQGRFLSEGYYPFTNPGSYTYGYYEYLPLVPIYVGHPLLEDVNTFNGGYYSYRATSISLHSGSVLVGSWSDGNPLIFYGLTKRTPVVVLNFYLPSSYYSGSGWDYNTDGAKLMRNALFYAADCMAGADCEGNINNGCEPVNTLSSCGACGVPCTSVPLSTGVTCFNGYCEAATCEDGYGDCDEVNTNGCESPLNTNANCISCGNSCNGPNANSDCSSGTCFILACDDGYGDCDSNPWNGCETHLISNANCGDCGVVCYSPYEEAQCNNAGACIVNSGVCTGEVCDNNVLILAASYSYYVDDVAYKLRESHGFNTVTIDLEQYYFPPLEYLLQFDAVMVFSYYGFSNSTAMGDLLADYVDNGGAVVQCSFTTYDDYPGDNSINLNGRFVTENYQPFLPNNGNGYSNYETGYIPIIPSHELLLEVDNFSGGYSGRGILELQLETILVATWPDGAPLVAYLQKPGRKPVVLLNFFPPSSDVYFSWLSNTNGAQLMRNALLFSSNCLTSADCGDGCVPLITLNHCGSCENDCTSLVNSQPICQLGQCSINYCYYPYGDCTSDPGCETDLQTVSDCGSCGTQCGPYPDSTADCSEGCSIICSQGYLECDGYYSNGCESVQGSLATCSECGDQCYFPNADSDCIGGVCTPAQCISGTQCAPISIALLFADSETNALDVRSILLSTGVFLVVDYYDVQISIPDLATLLNYKTVFFWSGVSPLPYDPVALGNLIESYIENGRGFVQATFSTYRSPYTYLYGQFAESIYNPFNEFSQTYYSGYASILPVINPHFLLEGVSSFNGGGYSFRGDIRADPNTLTVADWTDGIPLVMYTLSGYDQPIITLNFYPPSSNVGPGYYWDVSTDGDILMKNALLYAAGCTPTADCNSNIADGCDLLTTTSNCGGCGVDCYQNNVYSAECFLGQCEILACDQGFGDCDGYTTNGCEYVANELNNCNGCGTICAPANTIPDCSTGICDGTCLPGWADCNNDMTDGCEIDITSDANNCNSCGYVCILPYAISNCTAGECVIESCRNSSAQATNAKVLILATDGDTSIADNLRNTGRFSQVDTYQIYYYSTPSLSYFLQYNAILVYSNNPFSDPTLLGDTLADYVDSGGGVVIATFATESGNRALQGRWASQGYSPFTNTNYCYYYGSYLVKDIPSHPLFIGVNSLYSYYRCPVALSPGTTEVGHVLDYDSTPMVFYKTDNIVVLNFFPGYYYFSGDGFPLMANALEFSMSVPTDNCDGYTANGCEVLNTLSDCGACNTPCSFPHATASCSAGDCYIVSCDEGWYNCDGDNQNGCESDLSDTNNCGYCGNNCQNLYNVESTSCDGYCIIDSCNGGYEDCDGYNQNGCETFLGSVYNCGSCGNECSFPNAIPDCILQTCVIGSCDYSNFCEETSFNVLLLHTDPNSYSDVLNKIVGTEAFNIVDVYDFSTTIPDITTLLQYRAIFIYSWDPFYNAQVFGDIVSDYIDAGGGVVIAQAITDYAVNSNISDYQRVLGGRFQPYNPLFAYTGVYNGYYTTLVPDIPTHPLLHEVNSFNGGYYSWFNYVIVTDEATVVASWSSGVPLIAYSQISTAPVVALNFFPVSDTVNPYDYWYSSTDGATIFRNALYYSANCIVPTGDCAYTGECNTPMNETNNCGACGVVCDLPNAISFCSTGGECRIQDCDPGYSNCDNLFSTGCEVNLHDVNNCGGCDNVCSFYNGIPSCVEGSCTLADCEDGYGDCDGYEYNGCETPTNTVSNCGSCDNQCYLPNANSVCVDGTCQFDSCVGGELCSPLSILIIYADNDYNMLDVRDKLNATQAFSTIDYYHGYNYPPSIETLNQYDAVLIWSAWEFYLPYVLGDVLAQYVDNGGGVVQMHYTTRGYVYNYYYYSPNILGNFYYNGYQPFEPTGQSYPDDYYWYNVSSNIVEEIPNHPLLHGVDTFQAGRNYYRGDILPKSTSIVVANYEDGTPMILYNSNPYSRVVAVNFYPPSSDVNGDSWNSTTDGIIMIRNALLFAANCLPSADCDENTANGCESLYLGDNCGACGNDCNAPHSSGLCFFGTCEFEECDQGWDNCDGDTSNGCEFLANTLTDCGTCGTPCVLPNAVSDCSTGACLVDTCNNGYEDCDGIAVNGCEADLSSYSNCGSCGTLCSFPNSLGICNSTQQCELASCYTAATCSPLSTLIVHSIYPRNANEVRENLMETGYFARINLFDVRYATPDLELLLQFDNVILMSDYNIWDSVSLGNVIADYIDAGKGVVECLYSNIFTLELYDFDYYIATDRDYGYWFDYDWYWYQYCYNGYQYWYLEEYYYGYYENDFECDGSITHQFEYVSVKGRFLSGGYKPYVSNGVDYDLPFDGLAKDIPEHPILKGVNAVRFLDNPPRAIMTPKEDAILVAHYRFSGYPLVLYKYTSTTPVVTLNMLAYSNMDEGRGYDYTSDGAQLIANSLLFVSNCTLPSDNCDGDSSNGCELLNTNTNCGSCGVSCTIQNAQASCSSGSCELVQCDEGYDNCDGDLADGCDPLTTLANCGECGSVCHITNAIPTCDNFVCEIFACREGYYDCDFDIGNGCESITPCGPCTVVCTPVNADTTSCFSTFCHIDTCLSPYGDCDSSSINGCETTLNTLTDCGACGIPCDILNAVSDCSSGTCDLIQCDDLFGDCDLDESTGCELHLVSQSNCGACGYVCDFPNSNSLCQGGSCVINQCTGGFSDCDGDVTTGCEWAGVCPGDCPALTADCDFTTVNGCETPLTTLSDCGSCAGSCSLSNAIPTCPDGYCAVTACINGHSNCDGYDANGCETIGVCPGSCPPDFADCNVDADDGCEVDLNQPDTCGGCTNICSLFNAVPGCASQTCTVSSCTNGYSNCDGYDGDGCETMGVCPGSCPPDFADCNLNADDGCEVDLNNIMTCGGCLSPCAVPNAIPSCINQICGVSSCLGGYSDCDGYAVNGCEFLGVCPGGCAIGSADCNSDASDGCEVDITTISNCGACSNICKLV